MTTDENSAQATAEFLARFCVSAKPGVEGTFIGACLPAWPGRAFGGQLAAQCLQAAFAVNPLAEMKP